MSNNPNNNDPGSSKNITFFKYKSLEDMLKVILYSSQSPIGLIPMLYYINKNNQEILFIQTGNIGGVTIHYFVLQEKIHKKFIQLKRLTGEFNFVENIGLDTLSIYIPILELENINFGFPQLE
ncbi:MAG TPA: hypothetical protein VIY08_08495 [Candidatus Nitrosocosmicus sp.]